MEVNGCPYAEANWEGEEYIQRHYNARYAQQHLPPWNLSPHWLEEGVGVIARLTAEKQEQQRLSRQMDAAMRG